MRPRKKVSTAGIELIEGFEGFRPTAAALADGRWTIGYGHTQSARAGLQVSRDEARLLLLWDLRPVEAIVDALVVTPLNQNQYDALVAFAFNVGLDAFKDSQVLRLVNEGRFTQAACALDLWRRAEIDGDPLVLAALIRRRAAEKELFLAPVEGETQPPTPSPLVRPEVDPAAGAAVPDRRPVELETPMSGEVAETHVASMVEPRSAAPIAIVAPVASAPAPQARTWSGALSSGAVLAAPARVEAPEPEPAPHSEPTSEPQPGVNAVKVATGEVADAEIRHDPVAQPDPSVSAAAAAAAFEAPAAAPSLQAANESVPDAEPPTETLALASDLQSAPVAGFATPQLGLAEAAAGGAIAAVVVPLFAPEPESSPAADETRVETQQTPPLEHDLEPWNPAPSSWGVEPGQIAAVAVAARAALSAPVAVHPAPAPAPEPEPVAIEATSVESAEAPAHASAPPAPQDSAAAAIDSPIQPAVSAPPRGQPQAPAPADAPSDRVFASYGPMAFAFMKPPQREVPAAPPPTVAPESRPPEPEPKPAPAPALAEPSAARGLPKAAPAAPTPPRAAPLPTPVPRAPATSNFGPMFIPETRTLASIAPAPAITAEAPEVKPLVLTSPPADWDDARYGVGATVTALSADVDELETPLFDDGWDAPSVLSGRIVRHEATEEDAPPARSLRFGATGPYMLLGLIGFVAFAGALFAFWRGRAPGVGGLHDPTVLAWVLALIGAACVSISVYFLMKRLGGAED